MKIANFTFGQGSVFVIAEIGNNHNGSLERALQLIDAAISAGANCVKFQIRNMEQVYRKKSLEKTGEDLNTEYILDLLENVQLSVDEHRIVREFCKSKNIIYMCTPWDVSSVELLETFEVPAYKIASADLVNWPLISRVIATGKPLILSTGMSSDGEVGLIASKLRDHSATFAMLHCNSTYPAPFADINLSWMKSLAKYSKFIGYSGHERGTAVSLGAVALGAHVIERHLTLDRSMEGPDHAASLEPEEFCALVAGVRELELAIGQGNSRNVSQGEMINRENLSKSLVAARSLMSGKVLEADDLMVRSPGLGLSPLRADELIGKTLKRNMDVEDYFFDTDITQETAEGREYSFSRPWGVPVRYHDFETYNEAVSPQLFEFHLSYSDMELQIADYISGTCAADFVVHAPELFSGSRLMDLASTDEEYRQFSLFETQRVINITRSLKEYFPNTQRPLIVANIGGFTMDKSISAGERQELYGIFGQSLAGLDLDGVELIPQTMAPFPWHFGGQRFQNLFIDPDEIVSCCERFGLRVCFDVSHSMLACNHFDWCFEQFVEKVAPRTAHLHIGDAHGVNGEGLQIGSGEIDFDMLGSQLQALCPSASFIPEIWQGHKNNGAGFWTALGKLEFKI
jgi:N-acetylneuraminate synthase